MEEINTEKIKTQMRKGILEMCILSAINKSKEAYVSDLIDALKSADMIVVEGTLYPLLTRLNGKNRPRGLHANTMCLPKEANAFLKKL